MTPLRPLWWLIGAVIAVCGFLWFSPFRILDKLTDRSVIDLYLQNEEIEDGVAKIKKSNADAMRHLKSTAELQDSVDRMGGVSSERSASPEKEIRKPVAFSETYKTCRAFRDSLLRNPDFAERIPVLHPVKNHPEITNHFGMMYDHFTEQELPHRGVDFFAFEGDTVIAPGAGTVLEVASHRGLGLSLKIEHTAVIRTFYAHLDRALVRKGAKVHRGDPIAIIGKSGRTAGPGLHYEVRLEGEPVNPEDYFISP